MVVVAEVELALATEVVAVAEVELATEVAAVEAPMVAEAPRTAEEAHPTAKTNLNWPGHTSPSGFFGRALLFGLEVISRSGIPATPHFPVVRSVNCTQLFQLTGVR